jgi:hypothetical protein
MKLPFELIDEIMEYLSIEHQVYIFFPKQAKTIKHTCANLADTCAGEGHLNILKWFYTSRKYEYCSHYGVEWAAMNGHLNVIKWLHENTYTEFTQEVMDLAIDHGHINIAKWLHANRSEGCSTTAMVNAVKNNDIDTLEWLYHNYVRVGNIYHEPNMDSIRRALQIACENGNLKILEYLNSHFITDDVDFLTASMDIINSAASDGHLHIIQWIYKTYPGIVYQGYLLQYAANNGHLHIIEWYNKNYKHETKMMIERIDLEEIADGGHLHIIQWLKKNYPEYTYITGSIADRAAAHGHLQVIKWVYTNYPSLEYCTAIIMNAASNGYLNILKYSYNKMGPYIDEIIIHAAIMSSNENIINWLSNTYNINKEVPEISPNIMKSMIRTSSCSRRLHSLKWIYKYYKSGVISNIGEIIYNAFRYGYLDILKWVHDIYPIGPEYNNLDLISNHISDPISKGYIDIVKYILENYPDIKISKDMIDSAYKACHFDMVVLLYNFVE